MARVVSSMSRTTPRRMPAVFSEADAEDPGARVARVARHLGDGARRPWWSRGRARRPAAGAERSCARPADDHLAGEASIEFLIRPPAPGERLLHRHHRSNVLRGNLCAEPEAPPPDLEYHVRPHPPRRPDSREQVGIDVPHPREHSRDHRIAIGRAPADRAPSAADRTGAPVPARPAARARRPGSRAPPAAPRPARPRAFPAAGGRLRPTSRPASRRPGAASGAGSSNTLAFGDELAARAITFAGSRYCNPAISTRLHPEKVESAKRSGSPNQSASPSPRPPRSFQPGFRRRPATGRARDRPA